MRSPNVRYPPRDVVAVVLLLRLSFLLQDICTACTAHGLATQTYMCFTSPPTCGSTRSTVGAHAARVKQHSGS
jgi:hypothetical protein